MKRLRLAFLVVLALAVAIVLLMTSGAGARPDATITADNTAVTAALSGTATGGISIRGDWRFEEGSGVTAHDSSPYDNDGEVHNASWVSGVVGRALHFHGTDDSYVEVPNRPELSPTKRLVIEVWIKPESYPKQYTAIVYKGDLQQTGCYGERSYSLWARSDGGLHFTSTPEGETCERTYSTASGLIPTGQWSHVKVDLNAESGKVLVFVNEIQVLVGSYPVKPIRTGDSPLRLGGMFRSSSSQAGFSGSIDGVAIYGGLVWKASEPWSGDATGPTDAAGRPWYAPQFDDSGWVTIELPDANGLPPATDRFYRVSSYVSDPSNVPPLSFASDDGIWIYVNGVSLGHWGGSWRQSGCVNRCDTGVDVPPQRISDLLETGTNTIAVMVSNGPGDSYFDLTSVAWSPWKGSQPWNGAFEGPIDGLGRPWHDPEFDDSSWTQLAVPDSDTIPTSRDRFYRASFALAEVPSTFPVWFASDDGIWLYVNGTFVGHWGGGWRGGGCVNERVYCITPVTVEPQDIAAYLHLGINTIAAMVSNGVCCHSYFDFVSPTPTREPAVLLLHGAGGMNTNAMGSLQNWLENTKGLWGRVESFEYDSACWGAAESARRLADYVHDFKIRMGVDKVYLVGHSFGGIVARYYIEELRGAENVEALVMVGTPNQGVYGADFLGHILVWRGCPWILEKHISRDWNDVTPGSRVLRALNSDWSGPPVRYRNIAGTADDSIYLPKIWPIIGQEPPNDCLVEVSSVELSDVVTNLVADRHSAVWPCTGVSAPALMEDTVDVFPNIWDYLGLAGTSESTLATAEVEGRTGDGNGTTGLRPLAGLFSGSIPPATEVFHEVSLDAAVGEAFFLLEWEDGSGIPSLQLTLTRPDDTVVEPGDPGVEHSLGAGVDEWRVASPASGEWSLEVAAGTGSSDATYSLVVLLETDVTFSLQADQAAYLVDETAQLTAELAQNTTPLAGATVVADVRAPDGSLGYLTLFDDGAHGDGAPDDGVYGNSLVLAQCGQYALAASADIVLTELRHREAAIAPLVTVPGDATMDPCLADDDDDGFDDDEELYVGTDPLDNCPDSPADAAWPLDVNNDGGINVVADVLNFRGRIGATPSAPNWWQRLDFNGDGLISVVGDVLMYRGRIGETCI